MGSKKLFLGALLLLLISAGAVSPYTSSNQPIGPVPGKFIVKLTAQAKPPNLAASLGQDNRLKKAFPMVPGENLRYPADWDRFYVFYSNNRSLTSKDVGAMLGSGNVEYIEPDHHLQFYDFPEDSLFSNQWYLHNTGQEYLGIERMSGDSNDILILKSGTAGVDAGLEGYYTVPPAEHTRVVVAIIDSGVDTEHPELQGQLWVNPNETADNGIDDDHNGYIDDVIGWDMSGDIPDYYYEPDPDNNPNDLMGHGTHCAGIVAARGDTKGVVGTAPNALIMALSIYPNFTVSTAVEAILYAVNSGAGIINISWGTSFESETLREALEFARRNNVFVSMAAGNTGSNLFSFPQAFDSSFCVAAGNSDGYLTGFSSWGPPVDVVAPGLDILSLRADGTDMYAPNEPEVRIIGDDSLYYLSDGTSMASPVVCGAAAVVLSVKPDLSVSELENALRYGARDILDPFNEGDYYPGPDTFSGWGYLDVDGSLATLGADGIYIVQPVKNQRYPGDLAVKIGPLGGYTGAWVLEYAMEPDPPQWYTLASGSSLPADSTIYVVGDEVEDGLVYLRLTDKYNESSIVSFVHVSRNFVEMTSPLPDEETKFYVEIRGSAYGPDFDSMSISVTQDALVLPLYTATTEFFGSDIYTWIIDGVDTGLATIQLIGHFGVTQIVSEESIHIASAFTSGWPATVGGYTGPTVVSADLNHDGIREVITTTSFGVFAFHGDGTPVAGYPVVTGLDMRSVPAIYDVDRDGEEEIICTAADGIHVLKYDGSYAEGWPQQCFTGISDVDLLYPTPTVARLGLFEDSAIVFVNDNGDVLAYEFNGDSYFYSLEGLFATFDVPASANYKGGSHSPVVTSADFNGDGLYEALVSYSAADPVYGLGIFDGRTGEPAFDLDDPVFSRIKNMYGTIFTDFDNDGLPEVVTYGYDDDDVKWMWVKTNVFDDCPGWPREFPEAAGWLGAAPLAADLDLDGVPEILFVFRTADVSRLYIFRADGTAYAQMDDQPYGVAVFDYCRFGSPIVANLTGDELPEIVFLTSYLFPGTGRERIFIFDHQAQPVPGSPIKTPASIYQSVFTDHVPLIDDIDSDGLVELALVSSSGDFLVWDFDAPYDANNRGRFKVDNVNSCILWPSAIQTGYHTEEPVLPASISLTQNYPNPFNPITSLRFDLPSRSHVRLGVYNILGRRVSTLIDREMPAGSHKLEFDGSGLASGIYLYRLEAGDTEITRKMVLVK